jgi:hypothetical protein
VSSELADKQESGISSSAGPVTRNLLMISLLLIFRRIYESNSQSQGRKHLMERVVVNHLLSHLVPKSSAKTGDLFIAPL